MGAGGLRQLVQGKMKERTWQTGPWGAQAGRRSAEGRKAGVAWEAECSLRSTGTELYGVWERRGLHRR